MEWNKMRFKFETFSACVEPIVVKEEFPLIVSSNGGWERWFQLEYEYYLFRYISEKQIPSTTVESEVKIYFGNKFRVDLYLVSGYDKYVIELKCQTFQDSVENFTRERVIHEDMEKYNDTVAQGVKYLAIMYTHWVQNDNAFIHNTDDTSYYVNSIVAAFERAGYNSQKVTNGLKGKFHIHYYNSNQVVYKNRKLRSVCFVMLPYDEIKHGFAMY